MPLVLSDNTRGILHIVPNRHAGHNNRPAANPDVIPDDDRRGLGFTKGKGTASIFSRSVICDTSCLWIHFIVFRIIRPFENRSKYIRPEIRAAKIALECSCSRGNQR